MRYLIVSPDRIYAHHLATLMRADGQVVDIHPGGRSVPVLFHQYIQDYSVDAMVLDLSGMSRTRGCSQIRLWRQGGGSVPLMVIARETREAEVYLNMGAGGCHCRQEDARCLPARLSAMLRRYQGYSSDMLTVAPFRLCVRSRLFYVSGQQVYLTRFEHQVMETLLRYRGQILSYDSILLRLRADIPQEMRFWSLHMIVSRLRQKISRWIVEPGRFIRTVRGRGYLLDIPEKSEDTRCLYHSTTSRLAMCNRRINRARAQGWLWNVQGGGDG